MRSKQMEESPEMKRKAGGMTGDNSKTRQRKRKKSEEDVKPKNTRAKSSTPSAKKKRNNPPRFQDTPGEVRHWLLSNFRRVEKGSPRTIERNEMHGEYLQYCQDHGIEKRMTPNIFGKYIRTIFPDLETCRVGPRNGQVRHYLLEKCEGGAKSPEEHRRDAEEPKEEEKVKKRPKPGTRFESEFDVRESDEEQVELVHEEFGSSASSGSEDIEYEDDDDYEDADEDESSYDSNLRGDTTSSYRPVLDEAKWKGKEKEQEVEVKWEKQMGPDSLLRGYFTLLRDGGWTPLKEEVETKQELQREVKSMKLLVHSPSEMVVDDEDYYDDAAEDDEYQIVPQYNTYNTYNNNIYTNNNSSNDHYPSYHFTFGAKNFNNHHNYDNDIPSLRPTRTARDLYFTLPVPTDEFLRTNIFLFCEMLCTFEKVLWPFIPLHESFLEREVVQSFPHTVSPQSLAVGVAVAAAACVQGHHEFSEWAFNVSCHLAEQLIGFPDVQLPMSFMTLGALAHMWMPHEKAGEYAKRLAYAAKVMCESLYYTHTEVYQQIHNYYALLSRGEQEIPTIDEDATYAVDCSPREEIVRTRTIVRRYITLQASSSWAASQVKKQFSNINSNNNSPQQQYSAQEDRAAKHLQHHVLEGIRTNLVNKCNELMFLPVSDCVRTHLSSSLYSVLVDLHFLLDDKEGALRMGLKLLHVLETDPVPYIVQFCYGLLELFLKCDSPEHVYTLMYVLTRVKRIKAIETFLGLCQYQLAAYNQARALLTPP